MQIDNQNTDEVSLKEVILMVKEYFNELIRKWYIILLVMIPFIAYFLYKAMKTPITYKADLTYMVNEDESGGAGGVNSILGRFGFGGQSTSFNMDKIVTLSTSKRILHEVLLDSVFISGSLDLLGNHLLKEYGLHDKWGNDQVKLNGVWLSSKDVEKQTAEERIINKRLLGLLMGDFDNQGSGLLQSTYQQESGILKLSVESLSEELSILIVNNVYEKLSNFYIDKSIEKQKETFNIVKHKTDSLRNLLNNTQYRLLVFSDTYKNLTLHKYDAQRLKMERNLQAYSMAYGEALRNLEVADFALKTATPFFQKLDEPLRPISPKMESKKRAVFIGGFLGGFLAVLIIFISKFFKDVLKEG